MVQQMTRVTINRLIHATRINFDAYDEVEVDRRGGLGDEVGLFSESSEYLTKPYQTQMCWPFLVDC